MYKAHYDKNPTAGFPPIPSVPITVPVDHDTLHTLCFTSRYEPQTGIHLSEEDLQKVITALVDAAQLLDQDLHVKDLQRAQQSKSGKAARTYFLKRNGSYGGLRQLKFSLSTNGQLCEASDATTGECAAVFDDGHQDETCGRYTKLLNQIVQLSISPYAPDTCCAHLHRHPECLACLPIMCGPYALHVCLSCVPYMHFMCAPRVP